jgi:hypothetical protein
MGAWGHRNFENDTALDFVVEIEEQGIQKIHEAITLVQEAADTEFLDEDVCVQALAAIEYIAAAKGKQSEDFPEDAEDWLNAQETTELKAVAKETLVTVIDRIRNNSGLSALWNDDGAHPDQWYDVLDNLEERIA